MYEASSRVIAQFSAKTDTITVLPCLATSNRALRVSVDGTNEREFYVMENRRREGWDSYLPGEGMLMWHIDIDTTAWNNNTVNVQPGHQRIDIVEADKQQTDATRSGDIFPGSAGVTQWTLTSWDGKELMKIDDITDRNGIIRLLLAGTDYKLPAPASITVSSVEYSSFVARWDEVEDAKSYIVSAYSIGTDGQRAFVNGLNNKVYTKLADVTVDGLAPNCDYTFDVAAQLASYISETKTKQVHTLPLAFAKRIPSGFTASDVTDKGFTAHWNEVPTADDYLLTVYRHTYSTTTTDQGYDFTDKYDGLPSLWNTNSQNFYSVKGYYGAAAPSLRLSKTNDYLTVAYPDTKIDGIKFWARSSKTGNRIIVEASDNNSDTWTEVTTLDVPTTASTLSVNIDGASRIRLRLEQTSGYIVIDDVTAKCRKKERNAVEGFISLSTGGETEYVFNGLEANETYSFRVQATSGAELSCLSPECVVTLQSAAGITNASAEDTSAKKTEYYDLTGAKINHPQSSSVYIVRQGNKTYKKVMK